MSIVSSEADSLVEGPPTDNPTSGSWVGRLPRWLVVVGPYLIAAVVAAALATCRFQPWGSAVDSVFAPGVPDNDLAWLQLLFQAHGAAGPVGVEPHLMFPDGLDVWSQPLLGLLNALFAWLTVGVLGMSSASSLLWFVVFSAALNAVACLFFLRGFAAGRFGAFCVAASAAFGISAYTMTKVEHLNLVAVFLVPVALGVVVRWNGWGRRGRVIAASGLAVAAALSPLWWVMVLLIILPFMAVPDLWRRRWRRVLAVGIPAVALVIGFLVQAVLFVGAEVDDAPKNRGPWDSNTFGGHLVDIVMASPFVNAKLPLYDKLAGGNSVELQLMGLMLALGAALTIIMVFTGPVRRVGTIKAGFLAAASLVSLLLFLLGGLGNAQAAAAVILGGQSPGRVWARVAVVLGLLGIAWLIVLARAWVEAPSRIASGGRSSRVLSVVGAVVVTLMWWADSSVLPGGPRATPVDERPHNGAVQFIREVLQPCPVAQLPATGLIGTMGFVADPRADITPYITAPEFFWSYGYRGPDSSDVLSALATAVDDSSLQVLKEAGYCAVLLDEVHAEQARGHEYSAPGEDPNFTVEPDYMDERFSVYLLD